MSRCSVASGLRVTDHTAAYHDFDISLVRLDERYPRNGDRRRGVLHVWQRKRMKRLMDIGYYFRVMQFDRCGYLAEEQSQFQSRISSGVFCLKYCRTGGSRI